MACSQPWVRVFLRYMPSPFYSASVVPFQLHGGMVSHMQALVYQYWLLVLAGSYSSSLVSVLFREAFSHPYISFFIY